MRAPIIHPIIFSQHHGGGGDIAAVVMLVFCYYFFIIVARAIRFEEDDYPRKWFWIDFFLPPVGIIRGLIKVFKAIR